eukprot:TRINITY_DN2563_c0_g2_i1.p2 TRINITY_DN2563_c0_g2~~TRINITY_DN2563_c0_g2_i1.p2  ORF type:complete len:224 (-),score=-22.20 TRINITY_DN2563_c0_g2_i1:308-979(-)
MPYFNVNQYIHVVLVRFQRWAYWTALVYTYSYTLRQVYTTKYVHTCILFVYSMYRYIHQYVYSMYIYMLMRMHTYTYTYIYNCMFIYKHINNQHLQKFYIYSISNFTKSTKSKVNINIVNIIAFFLKSQNIKKYQKKGQQLIIYNSYRIYKIKICQRLYEMIQLLFNYLILVLHNSKSKLQYMLRLLVIQSLDVQVLKQITIKHTYACIKIQTSVHKKNCNKK